jgi:4-hydroxy-2-oxoheptanedioate aldolase
MNSLEKRMVEILVELQENHHVSGVKAEFETEGTRITEAMRLKEISLKAGLSFNLKIGGCEAIRDMFDGINLGIDRLIAPMVETAYSLQKYLKAARRVLASQQIENVELLINIETITACQNFEEMLGISEIKYLTGIVIGRMDLACSLGLSRTEVNSQKVLELALQTAKRAKTAGLSVAIGGGVSVNSLPFFKMFSQGHIDRFETRKVIFNCPSALDNSVIAFQKAIEFELFWLENKKNYYGAIFHEDEERLETLNNLLLGQVVKDFS